jgi:hypothetical protein
VRTIQNREEGLHIGDQVVQKACDRASVARINAYAADPTTAQVDIDTVKGRPGIRRIRWGAYRALFRIEGGEMQVIRIAQRKKFIDGDD